jgi:uncharacterized protein YecT (DUF1311 family)
MKFRIHVSVIIFVASILFGLCGMAHSQETIKDIDCSNPKDQASMGICQARKTDSIYSKLQVVAAEVANTMQGGRKELFENYQAAWEKYISAKCLFDKSHYGSMYGQMVGICEEEFYNKRINELKRLGRQNKE